MSTVVAERGRRRPHEVRRAEQAHLLAREGGEDERPRRTRRRGECPRECHHRGRAGGIVVRSGMDGAGLVGRQRPFAAPAQMIVVRADHDGLVREARVGTREHADHVRRESAVANQADLDPDPRARQRQRARGEASIDGLGQLGQAHAGGDRSASAPARVAPTATMPSGWLTPASSGSASVPTPGCTAMMTARAPCSRALMTLWLRCE